MNTGETRRETQTSNARTFAATLAAQAVGPIVISPGSRSTPLVLACAEHPDLETVSVLDERSAAFFALGWARATGRPAVLLCTSGSAGGHYLPAIMEADHSELPLLVVTANRPIEREASGSSQTAVQRHLYGGSVRSDYEIDLALATTRGSAAIGRVVAQAVSSSTSPVAGPVHIDVRIRKPLEPDEWPQPARDSAVAPRWLAGRWQVDDDAVDQVVSLVCAAERPIVVVGPAHRSMTAGAEVATSLVALGLPLFCEWTSQLRAQSRFWAVGAGLQSARMRERLQPDLVLQVGTAPVTSGWESWIEQCARAGARHVLVQGGRMRDARSTATEVVTMEPVAFLTRLAGGLSTRQGHDWSAWHRALDAAHRSIVQVLAREWEASGLELQSARAAVTECARGVLGLGNSLAIRHAEGVPGPAEPEPGSAAESEAPGWSWVWHQRGLSGIDGLIAGMAGTLCAAADEVGEAVPARLLLGDVSLVHDLSSLGLLQGSWARHLDVVVLDNGGGRIFERLPLEQLDLDQASRELFATPPRVDLSHAVCAFGLQYLEILELKQLHQAFEAGGKGARLLHVRCPGAEVTADHRRILNALEQIS